MAQDLASEALLSESDLATRADGAAARGEAGLALRLWSEARSRFPAAPRAWLREAEVLLGLGRLDEAEAVLEEAVGRFPDDFWLARTRALAARAMDDDVEAYTRCRALRQAFPDNPAAHAAFVHLLLDLKQVAAAEAEVAASLARFPDLAWLRHMHARCAEEAGDTAAAAARWTGLLVVDPYHEAAYAPAVRALLGVGRPDEAAGLAREGRRLLPDSAAVREAWTAASATVEEPAAAATQDLLAGALGAERAGRRAEAAALWARLRGQAPELGLAHAAGARALLHLGRAAEAEIVLAGARRDLPDDAAVLETWAEAALQRGAFETALARFRSLGRASGGLARALHALGRLDEADAVYAELNEAPPPDPDLAQHYALIAGERGDWAEAARRWARLTAAFPDHLPGYWQRAEALAETGRWAEADAVLCEAVARFPEDLETALRWAASGRQGPDPALGASRSDVLCRRFPGIAPVFAADQPRSTGPSTRPIAST
jgi:tetratricopeptide (TPR) repeat protein